MKKWKRLDALILALMLINLSCFNKILANGDGPTQPEYVKFEPVDVTDMVNLVTGDFTYSLPLMEVPGPEGNFPIVLNYHSGIGTNQQSSWVGLGWSLNVGSINRIVNGYPDDFNGNIIETGINNEGEGRYTYLNASLGPVGMSASWDSHKGFCGANFYAKMSFDDGSGYTSIGVSYSTSTKGFGISAGYSFDDGYGTTTIGLSYNTSSKSFGGTISKIGSMSGVLGTFNSSISYSAKSGLGFSLSSTGGNISISGIGVNSQNTTNALTPTLNRTSGLDISIGIFGFSANFGFYNYKWELNDAANELSYGYIQQNEYFNNLGSSYDYGTDYGKTPKIKFERQAQEKYLFPTQDIYQVNSQGISGTFMPFYDTPYNLLDYRPEGTEFFGALRGQFYVDGVNRNYYFNKKKPLRLTKQFLTFKFLNEPGNNIIYWDNALGESSFGESFNSYSKPSFDEEIVNYSSKKIEPIINNSRLTGFTVTATDGKIYEYSEPIFTQMKYSLTRDRADNEKNSYTYIHDPFATSWLLTAIKGPDYVDRGATGLDDTDWGYWVKFEYADYGKIGYKSPSIDFAPGIKDQNHETMEVGFRDYKLLNKIETSTHFAEFNTSNSLDRLAHNSFSNIYTIPVWGSGNENRLYFQIPGNWIEIINNSSVSGNDVLFSAKFVYGKTYNLSITYNDLDFYNIGGQYTRYDEEKKLTFFHIKKTKAGGAGIEKIIDKKFYLGQILSKNNNFTKTSGKVLNTIELFNKSNLTKSIKSVKFNPDNPEDQYELCPGTPDGSGETNSTIAKYTLKSIKFYGRGGADINIPSYKFAYNSYNPSWDADNWDRWGSYRSPNGEDGSGFKIHNTPQDKNLADEAAAWNLTNITTPTGAVVSVDYESDDYYYVEDIIDLENSFNTDIDLANVKNKRTIENIDGLPTILDKSLIYLYEKESKKIASPIPPYTLEIGTNYKWSQLLISNHTNNSITVNTDLELKENIEGSVITEYEYKLFISPPEVYGGGVRVKSLSLSDGRKTYTSNYKYQTEDGLSSGVTPTLPLQYNSKYYGIDKELKGDIVDKYKQKFLDHKLNYGRPSPGVIYSRVEVENQNVNKGKVVYKFYTSKDFPYYINDDDAKKLITIKNRSSVYGQPKSIEYYNADGNIVKKDEMYYEFSDKLANQADILYKGNKVNSVLGMIQEKYATIKQNEDDSFHKRLVDKQLLTAYQTKTISTEYSYSPNRSMTVQKNNFLYDYLSGSSVGIANINKNEGKTYITKLEPAYWHYSDMQSKNMLTQNAQSTSYFYDQALSESNLDIDILFRDNVISSEVTTWKNWGNNVWRKNDTYIATKTGNKFNDFSSWDESFAADNIGIWKRTSDITQYDDYSHPIESRRIDGNYSSSIYRYGKALPVAIISNAKLNEWGFSSFEDQTQASEEDPWGSFSFSSESSHTGEKSAKFNNEQYGPTKNFQYNYIDRDRTYILEAWVKLTFGTGEFKIEVRDVDNEIKAAAYDTFTGSGWQFVSLKISPDKLAKLPDHGYLRIWCGGKEATGYVDDIRFRPFDAAMSSYTYNILGKVTSITDENNTTTYYEYDDAGRLVKVFDQDKNLIQQHTYNYERF